MRQLKEPLKGSGGGILKTFRLLAHMGDTNLKRHFSESRFAEFSGGSADFTGLTAVYAIRTYGGVGGTPQQ